MKFIINIFLFFFILTLTACSSSSSFQKRKYTKGKFRLESKLKKNRDGANDEKTILMEIPVLYEKNTDSVLNDNVIVGVDLAENNHLGSMVDKPSYSQINEVKGPEYTENENFHFDNENLNSVKIIQPSIVIDTVKMELTETEMNKAIRAEKWSKLGRLLIIIGGILLFGLVTTAVGFLMMIYGLGFTIASLVSSYNTEKGRRMAWFSLLWFFLFFIALAGVFVLILYLLY